MNLNIFKKIEELFWDKAFSDISMDEVAKNLGLKKASLYHYFKSKDDMFLKTLNFSFENYIVFLENIFSLCEIEDIINELIKLPCNKKNLFAIVLQKGYCNNEKIKDFIFSKSKEVDDLYIKFGNRFSIKPIRIKILRSIIDDFTKKNCISSCFINSNFDEIIKELSILLVNGEKI